MNYSVIIPVFRAEKFIERAVESALAHKEVKEVILIEDGSPDNSLQVCRKLEEQHAQVKLFRHPGGKNKGAGASRNLGITKATQDFIAFLDADDYFTEIRFEKENEIFSKHHTCDGVYGAIGVEYVDEVGAKSWEEKGYNEQTLTTVSKSIKPEHLFDYLAGFRNDNNYEGYYSIIGFTVKRRELIESNIVFDESLKLHQDTVFLWQCAYKLRLFTGDYKNAIAKRRVHANNRFIHNKNVSKSRSLHYLAIRNWGIKSKMSEDYVKFFNNIYYKYLISSSQRYFKLAVYVKYWLTDKVFREYSTIQQLKYVVLQSIKH